jgi:hypothetical protein
MDIRTALTRIAESARIPGLGKTDEEIIDDFMGGQCWSLAVAHHRRYGWPIYCLGGYEDETVRDDWRTIGFYHVLNRHPNGDAIDIQGPHDVDGLLAEWGDVEFLPLTEDQLFALFKDQGRAPKAVEIAYAGKVIDLFLRPRYPALYPSTATPG